MVCLLFNLRSFWNAAVWWAVTAGYSRISFHSILRYKSQYRGTELKCTLMCVVFSVSLYCLVLFDQHRKIYINLSELYLNTVVILCVHSLQGNCVNLYRFLRSSYLLSLSLSHIFLISVSHTISHMSLCLIFLSLISLILMSRVSLSLHLSHITFLRSLISFWSLVFTCIYFS